MNWEQFKDLVSHWYLTAAVVASWSLTLKVAGSNPFNDKYFYYSNQAKENKHFSGFRISIKI